MARWTRSVAAELIRLLNRQVPAVMAANLVNSSLVVAALWHSADQRILMGWASAILLLTTLRVGLWNRYLKRPSTTGENERETARWARCFSVGATISGLLWGSAALLFIRQGDPTSLILIAFVIGGMAAGAVATLSSHLPAFYLYLATSMVPLEGRLLALGDRVSLAMSGMALVYVIGLVLIGRNFNAALIRALELNEENKRLLANMEHEVQVRTMDLQKARAEAERANQAKSRFLAAASHDLRQPMQSLFLFANALHHYVADRKGVDALVRIERGLDILKGMLDSLLDVSRLDVNVIQPQITTFPLRPMLDDIVVSYRRIAASKDIELRRGTLSDCLVQSDKTLLGRMIRNLIENAIRYTERGHITLSSHLSGETVHVEVEDTGIGIAPDQLERIFEEFHQVGNPERDKARGLGLGLAIVQRLSTVLGHSVEVRSQLGQGSTFSIEVPATEAAPAEPVSATNAAVPVGSGSGRQVVLIDDDPMVLLALGGVFEGWGYQVVMAGSQEEAFEQLRSSTTTTPHLIVADYRLRNGKIGTDAIRDLHATCGTAVPSIILTGETGKECVRDAEALGSMILHKPVTPHQLSFVLKRLFGEAEAG